jgi:lipopolysaccharide transport system ATP-binding protein
VHAIHVEELSKVYRVASKRRVSDEQDTNRGLIGRLGSRFRHKTREIWALKDVSLQVEPGTILGVIGHNGAGKTTLLKVLARITLPTSGRAIVRGRVVSMLALGQGFQEDLSARENIYLNAALFGIPQAEVERNFDQIVEFAGLGEFVDNPVGRFSSGMFLRLAFSVAVNMRPDVILADEVLAVGDIGFQERCLQRVRVAGEEGVAVLFVSHDMRAVERLCQRAIRIDHGQIVDEGDAREVVERYEETVQLETIGASQTISSVYLRVHRMALTSADGREIESPLVSDDFFVTATIETLVPDLHVRPILHLGCGDVLALRSAEADPLYFKEPGARTLAVRIPGDLLADRVYDAELKLDLIRDGEVVKGMKNNRLSFRVYDNLEAGAVTDALRSSRSIRTAMVAPRLEWTVAGDRAGSYRGLVPR